MSNRGERQRLTGVDRWDKAVSWYVTLRQANRKDVDESICRQWHAWCSDEENQRVFDDVTRLLARSALYRKRSRPRKEELENDRYDPSTPIEEWLKSKLPGKSKARGSWAVKSRWWLSGAVAAAATAIIVVLLPLFRSPGDGASGVAYQTGIAEIKAIHLNDGTTITLGGHTKLAVTFSRKNRSATLIRGQAWFEVAHDKNWPFVVSAGDRTISDVGTAFLVTRDSDRVVVTVTEGIVDVSARPSFWSSLGMHQRNFMRPTIAQIRVIGGEQVILKDNGALSTVTPADAHAATAWIEGRLTFEDQPLRYVIETVDRYSTRPIYVSPAAGGLRLSGIVFENDIQGWLKSLPTVFPVRLRQRGKEVDIEMRAR